MDDRTRRLGEYTAQTAAAWATKALDPVPADPTARRDWERQAAPIAAYREMYGYDHPSDPIGPEPGHQAPDQRAAWHQAYLALGPSAGPDVRAMPNGRLWLLRDTYATQTAWAPRHVGKELRLSRLGAFDAALGAARAEQASPGRDEKLIERVTRIRDLAAQRQACRAEMHEHPGLMVPGEDPVWGELGDAAPNSRTSGPDAILQPPRPEIIPSARLLQLAAEHDSEPDREAAD